MSHTRVDSCGLPCGTDVWLQCYWTVREGHPGNGRFCGNDRNIAVTYPTLARKSSFNVVLCQNRISYHISRACVRMKALFIFVFETASVLALGPHPPSCAMGAGGSCPGGGVGGRPSDCEADSWSLSGTEVGKVWSCSSTPQIRLHGVVLSYAQVQLYAYLT